MASNDIGPDEVDLLLKTLAAPPKAPPATEQARATPGWRGTNVQVLMPAARRERRQPLAFIRALALPSLPKIAVPWLTGMSPNTMSARVFVSLGVMLSAAMPHWPYAHAWSWGLLVYFAAIMLVVVTGIWSAKLTWDERLPAAHTVALGVVMWGVGLLAAEAVPRITYA